VSSSPWNIYDVIGEFLELQRIPMGPICLRDWDIELSALSSNRLKTHKEPLIREILELYPELPFILIGDTSQKDPEIYREDHEILSGPASSRSTSGMSARTPERSAAVQALAEEVLAAGSSLILADDTDAAARHAAENGWITKDALPGIQEERRPDQGETGTKVDAPGVEDDPKAPTVVVE
jgi:hypothetical protein